MAGEDLLVGIDFGTSHIKAIAFTRRHALHGRRVGACAAFAETEADALTLGDAILEVAVLLSGRAALPDDAGSELVGREAP